MTLRSPRRMTKRCTKRGMTNDKKEHLEIRESTCLSKSITLIVSLQL